MKKKAAILDDADLDQDFVNLQDLVYESIVSDSHAKTFAPPRLQNRYFLQPSNKYGE
jgi:hypothetical protein